MDENKAICSRCGATWTVNSEKRKKNGLRCSSCRMSKALVIKYGNNKCLPWHGQFDKETLSIPLFNGEPVLPGKRICGHSDCCNPEHIE